MSLSVNGMADAISSAIHASYSSDHPARTIEEFSQVLAAAIVPYLVANTVVIPTLLLAPPGTGGGPVTGTGTIT